MLSMACRKYGAPLYTGMMTDSAGVALVTCLPGVSTVADMRRTQIARETLRSGIVESMRSGSRAAVVDFHVPCRRPENDRSRVVLLEPARTSLQLVVMSRNRQNARVMHTQQRSA